MSEIIITVIYFATVAFSWAAQRRCSTICAIRPDLSDVVFTLIPFINVLIAIGNWNLASKALPGESSLSEKFFAIKEEDYWRREDE